MTQRTKTEILKEFDKYKSYERIQVECLIDIRDSVNELRDRLADVDTSIAVSVRRISKDGELYSMLHDTLDRIANNCGSL